MSFSRELSRCVVKVEVAICEEPDGPGPGSAPEVWLAQRLAASSAAIEVFFDELEHEGRRFVSPQDSHFRDNPPQHLRVDWDVYSCVVETVCLPAFDEGALAKVAHRVAALVFDADVVTDPGGPELADEVTDIAQRGLETKTSPARRRRVSPDAVTPLRVPGVEHGSDLETPLEVTPVERRPEEVVTRPVGVPSIKRPPR